MDGSSEFPSRPEMEQGLVALRGADRPARPVRRRAGRARRRDGERFVLHTSDGDYRCQGRSSRSASPSRACRTRPASSTSRTTSTPAPRRRTRASASSSSASRTPASSWRPACSSGPAASSWPRRGRRSCRSTSHSLDGVRARYIQPWEDAAGRRRVHPQRVDRAPRALRAAVSPCTPAGPTRARPSRSRSTRSSRRPGFTCPLRDLRALGVSDVRPQRLPSMTNAYESATVPGIYFARHDRAGGRRDEEVRHPGQLGCRPRPPLQRAPAGRVRRPAATGPRARAAGGRPASASSTSCSTP